MAKRRNLKESASTIEVVIAKSLSGSNLLPSELDEVNHLTSADLMTQHDLDSVMAEKVVAHIRAETARQSSQSMQTWQPDSRELEGGFKRTSPSIVTQANESISRSLSILEDASLEDITDFSDLHKPEDLHTQSTGRMLDYGHVKSDSNEGRMMRQALYEIGEYAKSLHEMLSDDDDLPQWCHYKVAVARSCVGKVKHYLEYKISHPKQK